MLHYAIVFFVMALAAALFGLADATTGASAIAQSLYFGFMSSAVVSLTFGLVRGRLGRAGPSRVAPPEHF